MFQSSTPGCSSRCFPQAQTISPGTFHKSWTSENYLNIILYSQFWQRIVAELECSDRQRKKERVWEITRKGKVTGTLVQRGTRTKGLYSALVRKSALQNLLIRLMWALSIEPRHEHYTGQGNVRMSRAKFYNILKNVLSLVFQQHAITSAQSRGKAAMKITGAHATRKNTAPSVPIQSMWKGLGVGLGSEAERSLGES